LHLADDEHLKSSLILVHFPQISFCASDAPAAGYQCSKLSFIFCMNPKFQSICNFCNKELKLCLLYIFSEMFPLGSDEMWQDCVLPIVSISDVFTQQETMSLTKQ
jgi:hypothetical protein